MAWRADLVYPRVQKMVRLKKCHSASFARTRVDRRGTVSRSLTVSARRDMAGLTAESERLLTRTPHSTMCDPYMSLPQDRSQQKHDSDRVRLLVPVIVLVLGATAIPVELRRFDFATLALGCNAMDLVENLILYVPVGVVLTRLGFWRAVMIATLLSLFAETCQLFMMHRFPSLYRSGSERRRSDDRSADQLAMADPRAGDQGECADRLAIAARGADGARGAGAARGAGDPRTQPRTQRAVGLGKAVRELSRSHFARIPGSSLDLR